MKTVATNTTLVDGYYALLENFGKQDKLELIARLSKSMKYPKRKPEIPIGTLYGSWESEESGEECVQVLKSDRNFVRKREEW